MYLFVGEGATAVALVGSGALLDSLAAEPVLVGRILRFLAADEQSKEIILGLGGVNRLANVWARGDDGPQSARVWSLSVLASLVSSTSGTSACQNSPG